jgi:two-component system NtrC family response regulator
MTSEALAALKNYSWPGNIRELANVIEHASILCDELPIDVHDLPSQLLKPQLKIANTDAVMTLRELEAHAIVASLERHSGNKTAASEELGISIKTLYNKLNQDILNRAA